MDIPYLARRLALCGSLLLLRYRIRKLNQAYFAFYGSYAAAPLGGGERPHRPAVRRVWRMTAKDPAASCNRYAG